MKCPTPYQSTHTGSGGWALKKPPRRVAPCASAWACTSERRCVDGHLNQWCLWYVGCMHAICTTSCRAPSVLTYIICVGATPPPLPRHCVGVCHHQHRHPARAPLLPALSCSCKSKRLVCELPYNHTHTVLLRAHAAHADSCTCRPEGLLAPKTTYVAASRQQPTVPYWSQHQNHPTLNELRYSCRNSASTISITVLSTN